MALCESLGDEMHKMSETELKIVQINLEGLGKLFRLELGVWEGSGEPPDYVLEEAREHLRRITEIREQIDELNGQRAWTDAERHWVEDHAYIATANGDFAINQSISTIHGQTAFSDLRKMPRFTGCAGQSSGQLYVPQY